MEGVSHAEVVLGKGSLYRPVLCVAVFSTLLSSFFKCGYIKNSKVALLMTVGATYLITEKLTDMLRVKEYDRQLEEVNNNYLSLQYLQQKSERKESTKNH